jgi:CBS domain-containing protein
MIYTRIGDLTRGRDLVHVSPDTPVSEACARMAAETVGALGVCRDGDLLGIVSERDVIGLIAREGRLDPARAVRDIMTADPVTIDVDESLADAQARMKRGGFRHLPVTDGDRVVSMVSFRDIPTEYRLMHERFEEYLKPEVQAAS